MIRPMAGERIHDTYPRSVDRIARRCRMRLSRISMFAVASIGLVTPIRIPVKSNGEATVCRAGLNDAGAQGLSCWCDAQIFGTGCTLPNYQVVCNASSVARGGVRGTAGVHVEVVAWNLVDPAD